MESQTLPNVLIVTGEASGERYAAQVVATYQQAFPDQVPAFYGSGGDAMRDAGVELISDIAELAAIGPLEALKLGGNYLRLLRNILGEVRRRQTKVALLVDFPDFNLFLARRLKKRGVRIIYYISPTVWAWRPGRMRTVRRYVDRMLCIFPFEEPLYRDIGASAEYVGHPMIATLNEIDSPADFARRYGLHPGEIPISVLPGSRAKEIHHILPPVLDALTRIKAEIPRARFLIPTASKRIREAIQTDIDTFLADRPASLSANDLLLVDGDTTNCLANSHMGIVKSGTSTLQSAVAGMPFVMVYRTSPLTWKLGRMILTNPYFCIVNLIAGREVVPELLQDRATGPVIAETFLNIFKSDHIYNRVKRDLEDIRDRLGSQNAPLQVARELNHALDGPQTDCGGNQ